LKTSTLLWIAGGAALLWYLANKATTLANLQFTAKSVSFQGSGLQLTVGILNPTNGELTINSIVGNVLVNGQPFGTITNFTQTVVAANAETDIILNISPNVLSLASDLINELSTGGPAAPSSVSIIAQGTANVNGSPLPVNLNLQAAA
jgi:hypothetical protein